VGGVPSDMGDSSVLPERDVPPPVVRRANAKRYPYFQADLGRIAAGFLGPCAQLFELRQRLVAGRIRERHPAIANPGDAPQDRVGVAAPPDRYAARLRARVDAGVVDIVVAALELHVRPRPQRAHHLHLLFRAVAAVVKILVQAFVFDLVPADTDAQTEAAVAEQIEAGGLFGDQDGLALRHDQDAGGEAETVGAAGEEAQHHERVVHGMLIGADADALGLRPGGVGAHDVVAGDDVVEAEALDRLSVVTDDGPAGADIANGQGCADLHGLLLWWWGVNGMAWIRAGAMARFPVCHDWRGAANLWVGKRLPRGADMTGTPALTCEPACRSWVGWNVREGSGRRLSNRPTSRRRVHPRRYWTAIGPDATPRGPNRPSFARPVGVTGSVLRRFCCRCAADAGVSRLPLGGEQRVRFSAARARREPAVARHADPGAVRFPSAGGLRHDTAQAARLHPRLRRRGVRARQAQRGLSVTFCRGAIRPHAAGGDRGGILYQWEFWFARHYRRRLSIYIATDAWRADKPAQE